MSMRKDVYERMRYFVVENRLRLVVKFLIDGLKVSLLFCFKSSYSKLTCRIVL